MKLFEILRSLSADRFAEDFTVKCRHVEDIEVIITVRDERDSVSLRRNRRTGVIEIP